MNASEIAKIEDVNERMKKMGWFLQLLAINHPDKVTLFPIAWDILNQQVTECTIALANMWWRIYDEAKVTMPNIELPDIVKLIANHNLDYQPGEEAFALLDDMMKVKV